MFADRTAWALGENALTRRRAALAAAGVRLLDLTESNPTRCGITYPPELWPVLADPTVAVYEPSPLGLPAARQAVARIYAGKGVAVDPSRVALTASTSEAYSFLFRLLANPGDEILVPRPSYPLFDYLAALHDLRPVPYPLRYDGHWRVDLDALAAAVTPKTRVVIVVHPNNPTGSCLTADEWARVAQVCADRGVAVIADEVFAEYVEDAAAPRTLAGAGTGPLLFALGGLSKWMGLPQMKLGWMAVSGPASLVEPALARLEIIADTFLSVNTPVQRALPRWLALAPTIQQQIRRRIADHRRCLRGLTHGSDPFEVLAADGGWSAVLRVPGVADDEQLMLDLLERAHVVVYPGYFYEFDEPGVLVVSLLAAPSVFHEGLARLREALEKRETPC